MYDQGRLAVIQGTGMSTVVNRSHFETRTYIDLGTPGQRSTDTGWLTRAANVVPGLPAPLLSTKFENQTGFLRADAFP